MKSKFSTAALSALGVDLCLPCLLSVITLKPYEMSHGSLSLKSFPPSLHQANPACLTGLRELLVSLQRPPWWPFNAPVTCHNTLITHCCPVPCYCSSPGQFLPLIPLALMSTEFADRVLLCTPATPPEGFLACTAHTGQEHWQLLL